MVRESGSFAGKLYDRAYSAAVIRENLQMEALSAEFAGKYFPASGRNIIAAAYLRLAHGAYVRWARLRDGVSIGVTAVPGAL